MPGFVAVGYFLFSLLFGLLSFVLWARIALRYFRINALHPMSQTIYTITNPMIIPLTRVLPLKPAMLSRYDWPSLVLLFIVELLKFTTISLLFLTKMLPFSLLLLYVLADFIIQPCNLLFYALLIRVLMSWINPQWPHPLNQLLYLVTEPLLRRVRRSLPRFTGLDFSPLVVLILLEIITLFIRASLPFHLV